MAFVTPVVEHWLEREIAQWVVAVTDLVDYFSSTGKHFSKDTPIMWASVVEDHCGGGGGVFLGRGSLKQLCIKLPLGM